MPLTFDLFIWYFVTSSKCYREHINRIPAFEDTLLTTERQTFYGERGASLVNDEGQKKRQVYHLFLLNDFGFMLSRPKRPHPCTLA